MLIDEQSSFVCLSRRLNLERNDFVSKVLWIKNAK